MVKSTDLERFPDLTKNIFNGFLPVNAGYARCPLCYLSPPFTAEHSIVVVDQRLQAGWNVVLPEKMNRFFVQILVWEVDHNIRSTQTNYRGNDGI